MMGILIGDGIKLNYILTTQIVPYKKMGILLGGCLTVKNQWVVIAVDSFSSIFKTKWHKSGTFLRLRKRQFSVIRWYSWRTSRDSNPEPTDQKTDVLGKQGQTATNKDNKINMIKGITYSGIFRNMVGFCKLVAQNWHKNFALVVLQ